MQWVYHIMGGLTYGMGSKGVETQSRMAEDLDGVDYISKFTGVELVSADARQV